MSSLVLEGSIGRHIGNQLERYIGRPPTNEQALAFGACNSICRLPGTWNQSSASTLHLGVRRHLIYSFHFSLVTLLLAILDVTKGEVQSLLKLGLVGLNNHAGQ